MSIAIYVCMWSIKYLPLSSSPDRNYYTLPVCFFFRCVTWAIFHLQPSCIRRHTMSRHWHFSSVIFYRNWRYEQELQSLLWKIDYKELNVPDVPCGNFTPTISTNLQTANIDKVIELLYRDLRDLSFTHMSLICCNYSENGQKMHSVTFFKCMCYTRFLTYSCFCIIFGCAISSITSFLSAYL